MKRIAFLFLLCTTAFVQVYAQTYCSKQAPKISYEGRSSWAIDGQINDWNTLLGPYSPPGSMVDGIAIPFLPPQTSAFNWVLDRFIITNQGDRDMPPPESDLHFLAFMHDSHNLYFYFRRQALSNEPNTFYYFMDVNGDNVMNNGEPVIHATFTNSTITALTISRYVVNTSVAYSAAKQGNFMVAYENGAAPGSPELLFNNGIDNFPMPGSLIEVFNANTIPPTEKLKKNETFEAAVTEGGYGVELAIPWSYLKAWIVEKDKNQIQYAKTKALEAGEIAFYHVSMQPDALPYNPASVVDNAGSCGNGTGITGNPSLSKSSTVTTIAPGSAYDFNIRYTNLTNLATEVDIQHVLLKFKKTSDLPVVATDFVVNIYPDINCNGVMDAGETPVSYNYNPWVNYDAATDSFTVEFRANAFDGAMVTLPAYGSQCLVANVTLPTNGSVKGFKIEFETAVFFKEGKEYCEPSCGGKPINQVGFVQEEVPSEAFTKTTEGSIPTEGLSKENVTLYPNPSSGISNLRLNFEADITVEDNLGRSLQKLTDVSPGNIQLRKLQPGFYIIKIKSKSTGKTVTKKLIVH